METHEALLTPPSRMRKRLTAIIAIGALAIGVVWLLDNDPSEVFSSEPKYDGHTLTYWMQHWYAGSIENVESRVALQTMGTNALPSAATAAKQAAR